MRRFAFLILLLATPVFAQGERYELGRRLHDFEVAWDEKSNDAKARKRAATLINESVQTLFKLNLTGAAKLIDDARHALESADPAPVAVRWADSLQVLPETRAVDAAVDDMTVTIKSFYKVDVEAPKGVKVRAKLGTGKPVEVPIESLPATVKVPVAEVPGTASADFKLTAEIVLDGKVLANKQVGVSRIEKFADRYATVKKIAKDLPSPPTTIEEATFALLVKMLEGYVNKTTPETDFPASRLTFGAERMAKAVHEPDPYYIPSRPGDFWLSIPIEKKTTIVRIRIPPKLETKKEPVPILFALHGMAGSENLFFEGYGDGIVPRMAGERGWIVVAPRVEGLLGAGPAPNVPGILDALTKRYPIDINRVYVVGHSMGAGHAIELAQKHPDRFGAVAALGGGGKVTKPEAIQKVRFFVGCGKMDVAIEKAKTLHKELSEAKAPSTLKEYEDIEHMLIVREAAADVFKFFEQK
jgi:predicted esterase